MKWLAVLSARARVVELERFIRLPSLELTTRPAAQYGQPWTLSNRHQRAIVVEQQQDDRAALVGRSIGRARRTGSPLTRRLRSPIATRPADGPARACCASDRSMPAPAVHVVVGHFVSHAHHALRAALTMPAEGGSSAWCACETKWPTTTCTWAGMLLSEAEQAGGPVQPSSRDQRWKSPVEACPTRSTG